MKIKRHMYKVKYTVSDNFDKSIVYETCTRLCDTETGAYAEFGKWCVFYGGTASVTNVRLVRIVL